MSKVNIKQMVMQGRYFTSMLKKGNLAVHGCGQMQNFSSGVEIVFNTNNKEGLNGVVAFTVIG